MKVAPEHGVFWVGAEDPKLDANARAMVNTMVKVMLQNAQAFNVPSIALANAGIMLIVSALEHDVDPDEAAAVIGAGLRENIIRYARHRAAQESERRKQKGEHHDA